MGSTNSDMSAVLYTSHERKPDCQIVSLLFSDEVAPYFADDHTGSLAAKKTFARYGMENDYINRESEFSLSPTQGYTTLRVKIALEDIEERGFCVDSYTWINGDDGVENWITAPKSGEFSWHQIPNACFKVKLERRKDHNTAELISMQLTYRLYKEKTGQFDEITVRNDTSRDSFEQSGASLPFDVWVQSTPSPLFKIS